MNPKINMIQFKRVAVLMGGTSAEREVSLRSGQAVLASLKRSGIEAYGLDLNENAVQQLLENPMDIAFIALHGRGGEDGRIQGVLEWLGIPYTGSGVLASALAMDKYRTKEAWWYKGLSTPKAELLTSQVSAKELAVRLGFPIMVKPNHEGSSIGLSKVRSLEELEAAIHEANQFDHEILAESFVEGREFTVSVLNGEALPVIGVKTSHDFYDFSAKYAENQGTQYLLPCGLSPIMEERLKKLAVKAFQAINCQGWARVDMMLDLNDTPWLIEINTSPGMTETSLFPKSAAHAGIQFDELVIRLLDSA